MLVTVPVDVDFDDDLSFDDVQTYVVEDFQHSATDNSTVVFNQAENKFADDHRLASYEPSSTVRKICASFFGRKKYIVHIRKSFV